MNDHHLDDLIIGDPEPGSKTSKMVLTLIALLIVIAIVGLILWALLFGSGDSESTIPLPASPQQNMQKLDPGLAPLTPQKDTEPVSTPPAVQKPAVPRPKPKPKPIPKPLTPVAAQTAPDVSPAPVQSAPSPSVPPKKGTLIRNTDKPIYYVQVGAFKRDPSPRFMKKLKMAGFTFITKSANGIRRVRVGPYDSSDEAKAALPIIKAKIGVDGLIVKF